MQLQVVLQGNMAILGMHKELVLVLLVEVFLLSYKVVSLKMALKLHFIGSSLRYLYNKVTKFDVDARHGERAASFKDNAGHSLQNTNNFGFSHRASSVSEIGRLVPDFLIKSNEEVRAVFGQGLLIERR
ncbi:hypothetical protein BSPWISOXPB_8538 [uncultured Gammaproteobacteria bacterium]|nr:hypothetical protein BSPWISOXPB_8538 [uncultured Gammaproteobacteria bacterium]